MSESSAIVPAVEVYPTDSLLTSAHRWDHLQARWGIRRSKHRVKPGLYALGQPTPDAPVFVTANYTLSFDALRTALAGIDSYILALDTHGINVWCAAGKGTFGTEELVRRIESTALAQVVRHRTLILPQLGATGVAGYQVRMRSGFKVEYGPVRAADLPEYLKTRQATPAMRQVTFPLWDRLVLTPMELVHALLPALIGAAILWVLDGWLSALGWIGALLAGTLFFPLLLPWLPTRDFSSKGLILGFLFALPFVLLRWLGAQDADLLPRLAWTAAYLLAFPAAAAYLALNFTGSSTFTSKSSVEREMRRYIRPMAAMAVIGTLCALGAGLVRLIGGLA